LFLQVASSTALKAQDTARAPVTITDFVNRVSYQGSYVLRGQDSVDLYNDRGELLETLPLAVTRRINPRRPELTSTYNGSIYSFTIINRTPDGKPMVYAATLKTVEDGGPIIPK
jgi:hypothetical protein